MSIRCAQVDPWLIEQVCCVGSCSIISIRLVFIGSLNSTGNSSSITCFQYVSEIAFFSERLSKLIPLPAAVATGYSRRSGDPGLVCGVSDEVGTYIWGRVRERLGAKHRRLQPNTTTAQFIAWLFVKHNRGGWGGFCCPGIAESNGTSEVCQGPSQDTQSFVQVRPAC